MKKEKELDNLTRDVLAAEAAGFCCHYGDYIAKFGHTGQPEPKKTDKRAIVCLGCGTVFYVSDNHRRKYCSPECRYNARYRQNTENKKTQVCLRCAPGITGCCVIIKRQKGRC